MPNLSQQILIKLTIDGKEFITSVNQAKSNLSELNKTAEETSQKNAEFRNSTKQAATGTKEMDSALHELGSAMGEVDEFLKSFEAGTAALLEHIPKLVQGFASAKTEASNLGTTVGKQLVASLAGPAGLNLAIQGVMLLLEVLPGLFSKNTEEIRKQKEEVYKLKDSYKDLTLQSLKNRLNETNKNLQELETKHSDKIITTMYTHGGRDVKYIERKAFDEERFGKDYDWYKSLQNMKKALSESIADLGDYEIYEANIRVNKSKLKKLSEKEFEQSTGIRKTGYWKDVVPEATSYQNAIDILNKWIVADENALRSNRVTAANAKPVNLDKTEETPVGSIKQRTETEYTVKPLEKPDTDYDIKRLSSNAISPEQKEKLEREEINDAFTLKRREANIEYQITKEKYGDLEILRRKHQKKLAEIDKAEAAQKLKVTMQTFALISGLFAKHTAAYKAFAIGNTIIDTYQAAIAAYKSAAEIPFIGHILGPVAAAAALKFGYDQVAAITGTDNSMPGYAKGGAVVGENGPEIIAPFQDYASGQTRLITMTMMTLKEELRRENGRWKMDNVSWSEREFIATINKLNKKLDEGINSRAYLDDRQARKLYNRGSILNRRSKI